MLLHLRMTLFKGVSRIPSSPVRGKYQQLGILCGCLLALVTEDDAGTKISFSISPGQQQHRCLDIFQVPVRISSGEF